MTIDYRGFGLSTGFPTESGIITDSIATVDWAINTAKVPSRRIVLIGQSLGTAVTTAVAEHFVKKGTEFAGVILIAGFTDLPNLLLTYSLAGYLPILSPLRPYRRLYNLLADYLVDTWQTATRLANFVQLSKRLRLFIIHAKNDFEIPWTHSEELFAAAANATVVGGMNFELFKKMKARSTVNMGDGAFVSTWKADGSKMIQEEILAYGCKDTYSCGSRKKILTHIRS